MLFAIATGWAGNSYVMGGRVKGGRILGEHPNTYNPAGTYNTGSVFPHLMLVGSGKVGSYVRFTATMTSLTTLSKTLFALV